MGIEINLALNYFLYSHTVLVAPKTLIFIRLSCIVIICDSYFKHHDLLFPTLRKFLASKGNIVSNEQIKKKHSQLIDQR